MKNSVVVHGKSPHKHNRGECMEDKSSKYAETYKKGNTTIHIVAPPPMTEEKKQRILDEFHEAAWEIWDSLTLEEKLAINEDCKREKKILADSEARGTVTKS